MRACAALAALTFCLYPTLATAGRPRGRSSDHGGFYGRLQLGLGGARARTEILRTDLTFSGGAGALNLELGGAVARNLILFGKLYGLSVPEPEFEYGDLEGDADDLDGSFRGFGAGLTYYLMPSNVYLSGALTLSRLASAGPVDDYDSEVGPMFHLGAGKEWFVADQVSLGLGLELAFGGFPDEDIDAEDDFVWGGSFLLVCLGATYN
jgi:hypothetical protein